MCAGVWRERRLLCVFSFCGDGEGRCFDSEGDFGSVEQGVVDEAVFDGFGQAFTVGVREFGEGVDFDNEIGEAWDRRFHFVAGDVDARAFACEFVFAEILRGVIGGAGAERGEQQFGRSDAFVEAAVFERLIADDGMMARFNFELHRAEMFDGNFHKNLSPGSDEAAGRMRRLAGFESAIAEMAVGAKDG